MSVYALLLTSAEWRSWTASWWVPAHPRITDAGMTYGAGASDLLGRDASVLLEHFLVGSRVALPSGAVMI